MQQFFILTGTFFLGATVTVLIIFSLAMRNTQNSSGLDIILTGIFALLPFTIAIYAFVMAASTSLYF